jgi:predicted Zn-dependent peptidase
MRKKLFLLVILLSLRTPLFSQERFRKSPPFPEPLQELRLPPIESAILTNGLTLSLVFRENLSLISLQLVILAGESSSPPNLPGMATFTANMLDRGTLSLSSSRIEETIESTGGDFSISTSLDYSSFTLNFLEEYIDKALDILSKMILQPAFLEREIENVKRTMFYDLLDKAKDPEFLAKRLLLQLLFKNHPYSKISFNEDFIRNMSQKDVLSFFDKYYRPNNAILVLSGNLNLTTASKKVSHYLNTWENKDLERSFLPPPPPNDKEKVCFIDLPQAKDCTIYLGNVVLPITSPDFFPFIVLNQVLGGTPNSRLFMNLRESKGYAYFAFSDVEFYKSCGVFFIKTKVTPEVAYTSIQEILKEIRSVIEEKISTFEIEQAKSYLIGNFPLKIERFDNFSSRISDIKAFRLGEEHWNKYYENIMLIDSEKVFEVAQKYPLLTPIIIVVGDKNVVIESLKEFEKVEVYNSKGILQYTLTKGEDE